MLNKLFCSIFPKAPPVEPQKMDDVLNPQSAIITALVSHIQADGTKITAVRIPKFFHPSPDIPTRYAVPGNIADFEVVAGLDVEARNVLTEATGGVATTDAANSSSASTTAETVANNERRCALRVAAIKAAEDRDYHEHHANNAEVLLVKLAFEEEALRTASASTKTETLKAE